MADDVIVRVDGVSKKFCRSLKHVMLYGVKDIARNMVGLSARSEELREGEFWAVDNASFELHRGETLGLIGPNGSGKSTLLKMLNGIFMPDKGKIEIKGRIGALIEVGAGFHPMLSGRENVYINGAILGMGRKEIDRKFDEIVEFADIGDFIDAPVKHYSSGMFARLGFSIAAHLKPDVLLVDEILSVGDLAFALKARKKIAEYMLDGGSTILVSHSIQVIRNICSKVIWLNYGQIKACGNSLETTKLYEDNVIFAQNKDSAGVRINNDPSAQITGVEFLDGNNVKSDTFKIGDYFKLRIHFGCKRVVNNPIFTVSILNLEGLVVSSNYTNFDGYNIPKLQGKGYIDFCLNRLSFKPSKYSCNITLSEQKIANILDWHENNYNFTVFSNSAAPFYGLLNPFPEWQFN